MPLTSLPPQIVTLPFASLADAGSAAGTEGAFFSAAALPPPPPQPASRTPAVTVAARLRARRPRPIDVCAFTTFLSLAPPDPGQKLLCCPLGAENSCPLLCRPVIAILR